MHIKSATFALEEAIPILYQRYTKGIQKAGNFFGTTFGTRKIFSYKHHKREGIDNVTSRLL